MAHHAYFVVGDTQEGLRSAYEFTERELGLSRTANPDVMTLQHGLLSVEDARKLRMLAELAPTRGDRKVLIISASRLFHEAQNALLKLFEEPPAGTHLILVIPAEGMLLPTLRSRLLPLPGMTQGTQEETITTEAQDFLAAKISEREKIFTKIVERSKSDKDEEKQAARLHAICLVEGLIQHTYTKWRTEEDSSTQKDLWLFLDDLNTFLPILHERSAPMKLIFEHITRTIPVFIQ